MTTLEGSQTTITTSDGPMPAYLWSPPGGTGPGLLLLQEIFGVSRYVQRRGAALAESGYVVLAPELYWRLGSEALALDESAPGAVETAMGRASSLDWEAAVRDGVAALADLRGRPEVGEAGIVGFCFGGGLGFNIAAVADPECLVSYYGSSLPQLLELAPRVTAPSLHHFGLSDDYIDAATVQRICDAVTGSSADVEFHTYEGANHAFDNDDFVLHDAEASALAWERTLRFLAHHLPT